MLDQLAITIVKGEIVPPKYVHPAGHILAPPPSFTGKYKAGDRVRIVDSTSYEFEGVVLPMVEQSASMTYRKEQVRVALNYDKISYLNEEEVELL